LRRHWIQRLSLASFAVDPLATDNQNSADLSHNSVAYYSSVARRRHVDVRGKAERNLGLLKTVFFKFQGFKVLKHFTGFCVLRCKFPSRCSEKPDDFTVVIVASLRFNRTSYRKNLLIKKELAEWICRKKNLGSGWI